MFSDGTVAKLDKTSIIKIKYKNFGGSGQAAFEPGFVESQHHEDVAYYRTGLLSNAIDEEQTTFRVRRVRHTDFPTDASVAAPSGLDARQTSIRHKSTVTTIDGVPQCSECSSRCVDGVPCQHWNPLSPGGLVASTSAGDKSVLNQESGVVESYVTWLRIGDEYMKLLKVEPVCELPCIYPDAQVTVERGLWHSPKRSHGTDTSVLAPIYHGEGCHPQPKKLSPEGSCLRYAWDPARPYVAEYLADAYNSSYDGLWLDCFGATPHLAYNAIGNDMRKFIWNVADDVKYGLDGYVAAQHTLVERVRELTAKRGATHLYANNVDRWVSAPVLLKPRVLLDGGAKESFAIRVNENEPCTAGTAVPQQVYPVEEIDWIANMNQVMNLSAAGLPTMPIIGDAGCRSPQLVRAPNREELEDFGYASFLLAAGTRTSMYGIVPYYFRNATKGHTGGVFIKIHPRYFYPIGAPMQTKGYLAGQSSFQSMDLEGYRVAPCTFARLFETALVLVNPTANCSDASVPLNGTWYDPAEGPASQPITTVAMAPGKGRILLTMPLSDSISAHTPTQPQPQTDSSTPDLGTQEQPPPAAPSPPPPPSLPPPSPPPPPSLPPPSPPPPPSLPPPSPPPPPSLPPPSPPPPPSLPPPSPPPPPPSPPSTSQPPPPPPLPPPPLPPPPSPQPPSPPTPSSLPSPPPPQPPPSPTPPQTSSPRTSPPRTSPPKTAPPNHHMPVATGECGAWCYDFGEVQCHHFGCSQCADCSGSMPILQPGQGIGEEPVPGQPVFGGLPMPGCEGAACEEPVPAPGKAVASLSRLIASGQRWHHQRAILERGKGGAPNKGGVLGPAAL